MQEKYGVKGLKVLAITDEARGVVDAFVEKTTAKHGIVIEESNSADAFGIRGFPSSFLIGPDGKILTAGHPSEADIEKALELVRLPPELPPALSSIAPSVKKEKWCEARAKTAKLLEGATLASDDDKKAANDLIAWIDWLAQSAVDSAKAEGERGNWYEASLALEQAAEDLKGLPAAATAELELKAILADKAKKDEVTAGKRFAQAREKEREKDMKPKEALALYKPIASKYENTKAGKRAAKLVAEYEKIVAEAK